jgi:hypothetical protein
MVQLGYTVDLFSSRQGWLSDGSAVLHSGPVFLWTRVAFRWFSWVTQWTCFPLEKAGFQMVELGYIEDLSSLREGLSDGSAGVHRGPVFL